MTAHHRQRPHHRTSSSLAPSNTAEAHEAAPRPRRADPAHDSAPPIQTIPNIQRPFRPDVVVSAVAHAARPDPPDTPEPWYIARLNADVPARWFEVMPATWVEQIRRCAGPRGRVGIWTLAAATGLPSWQVRAQLERACRARASATTNSTKPRP